MILHPAPVRVRKNRDALPGIGLMIIDSFTEREILYPCSLQSRKKVAGRELPEKFGGNTPQSDIKA